MRRVALVANEPIRQTASDKMAFILAKSGWIILIALFHV